MSAANLLPSDANFVLSNTFTNWNSTNDNLVVTPFGFNNLRIERLATVPATGEEVVTSLMRVDLQAGAGAGQPGSDGTSVFTVYAEDASGTGQNLSQNEGGVNRNFVAFIRSVNTPTLPLTGTAFTQITGAQGAPGDTGPAGAAGATGLSSRLDIAYFSECVWSYSCVPNRYNSR